MGLFLNIVIDGTAYGMILFMIAVGLSVTMGLMRVVNLAHGAFALVGGALAHWFQQDLGTGFGIALVAAIAGTVILALPLELVLYRRIYRMGELQQVLATIGLTFLFIATINLWQGSALLVIEFPQALRMPVDLGFRTLPAHRLAVIGLGFAIILFLWWLLDRTRFGVRLRASVDNRDIAAAHGINTDMVYLATFGLGAALAAIGGIMGSELLPIEAYYPLRYMVLFLIVVAVGGMGSILGSFLAALGLGILETAARYLLPDAATISFFAIVILLLTLRPNGLMGRV
ncbi:branched-chain amino acid ABC transporter permease [Rhodobacterales bacterium HKCCE2091]|nr:branched-chain amino acid ABC transporter permease [Rhodobacterales bacterium HKCCE2091]